MNLLENYIIDILSVEDITEEFNRYMSSLDPAYTNGEKVFAVSVKSDCHGNVSISEEIWKESEYNKALESGYFLA